MSADKYLSIFSRQMEAIVYIITIKKCNDRVERKLKISNTKQIAFQFRFKIGLGYRQI